MTYLCPVCGYAKMPDPPEDYNICPCCGTEFGYHDAGVAVEQLRAKWIFHGAQWFSEYTPQPAMWDPFKQMFLAGMNFRQSSSSERFSPRNERTIVAPVRDDQSLTFATEDVSDTIAETSVA